ncbi:MAG: P-loop NTPase fold protein [Cyanobacteria bacterium P01_C01_bin.118]
MEQGLATTLKDAYRACDVKPLEGDDIERYYVPLEARQDSIINIHSSLGILQPKEKIALLFSGHVGSGKSSELARIAERWKDEFTVLFINMDEESDRNDLEYTDLYLVIIKQVEYALREQGIRFNPDLEKGFEQWFLEITEEREETVTRAVNLEAEATLGSEAPFLAKFLVKILAQIKGSTTDKKRIRRVISQEVSRMKADINLLLEDGCDQLIKKFPDKKGFLIILDNLDKCPPNVANRLFFDYANQLQELNCSIIYTVPIASFYALNGISPSFDNPPDIVPMVNIYQFDRDSVELTYDEESLNAIASLIEKRVDVETVFESREQLIDLARISGGHPRFLMQMMRTACLTADGRGHKKIQSDDVVYAVKQLQFRFERSIPREYYPVIAKAAIEKDLPEDDISQQLLFTTAILEYNGNNRWIYPNPLVRRSELYKRALSAAQS